MAFSWEKMAAGNCGFTLQPPRFCLAPRKSTDQALDRILLTIGVRGIGMAKITLRIDGMHCGACIRRVTQSLRAVAGADVEEVRLGAARVKLADGASANALIAGLCKAGFAARVEE
jgi:copper chaperone